jgi:hypothetical protein
MGRWFQNWFQFLAGAIRALNKPSVPLSIDLLSTGVVISEVID